MDFKEQVKKELEGLSRRQQIAFACRCAIRALPFLGTEGHFNFWPEDKQQEYLQSIFYALDISASASADDAGAASAADIAASAAGIAEIAAYGSASAAAAAADAVYINAAVAANASAVAASASASAANADAALLRRSILQDIQNIRSQKQQTVYIADYGEFWSNFQSALKKVDCSYWATLYQNIFENNFQIDQKALMERLSVPREIREQGAAAVGVYLEKIQEEGGRNLNEARIIILGDKGAGKTCVARKLKDPNAEMTTPEESTAGVDTSVWELPNVDTQVRIWDFAGHTVTHAVHSFFLSERCLYILVYNGRTENTSRLEYWLDHMKNYGKDSEAIILVNERDQHKAKIPLNNLKEKYAIKALYSFNVGKDKPQLKTFRQDVMDYIKNRASWNNQLIPKSYYQVKEELEQLFAKNKNQTGSEYIPKDQFLNIASKYDADNPEQLLKDLHALGISLWYPKMKAYETLILNPEWISQGVYRIINWVSNEGAYSLLFDSFSQVFKGKLRRYPKDKHTFLYELIQQYELAYEADDQRLVIPHLLNEDQPDQLPVFPPEDSLEMRYETGTLLPPNTISRFIVRHHKQIKQEDKKSVVWKYGVVIIDRKGSLAMVREIDQNIIVKVKGKEKTSFITKIRETLNSIFKTYQSLNPKLRYRIIDNNKLDDQEILLSERDLSLLNKRHKPYYHIPTDRELDVRPTIINYNLITKKTEYHINVEQGSKSIINGDDNSDNSTAFSFNFNFKDSNIALQGDLNSLIRGLNKKGQTEEAEELAEVIEILDELKEEKNPESLKQKGLMGTLQRVVEDMEDEDSKLYKTLEGLKRGKDIMQDIGAKYNSIAEWVGWPQVPKFFLKGEKGEDKE